MLGKGKKESRKGKYMGLPGREKRNTGERVSGQNEVNYTGPCVFHTAHLVWLA